LFCGKRCNRGAAKLVNISSGFSRQIRGEAKELNFPSILEEPHVLEKYLGIFVDYTCFSRFTRKFRHKQECDFLIKSHVFGLWF